MSTTTDPQFISSLGRVVNATNAAGNFADLLWAAVTKDQPDAPEALALADACENICGDLAIVLSALGWTNLPPCPVRPRVPVLEYVGSYRIAHRKGWEYAGSVQIAVGPDGLYLSNKGGTIGRLDTSSLPGTGGPTGAPIIDWVTGEPLFDAGPQAKGLTTYAGTLGGITWLDGRFWGAFHEFYNTASRDNLGIISWLPGGADVRGAWRAGPPKAKWQCVEIPNLNCAKWYDPINLEKFHANKTHEWITPIPSSWAAKYAAGYNAATGRQRPSGSNGGADGPALYAVKLDPNAAPGASLGAIPLLCYPQGSRTWTPGYCTTGDDNGTDACWIPGHVLFAWAQPEAGSKQRYLNTGPPCNNEKGWHAQLADGSWSKWSPMLYVYDEDDLGQVALGQLDPWDPQPVAAYDLSADIWMPNDPTCEGPFVTGLAYDGKAGLLYGVQTHAWDAAKTGSHKTGVAVHVWAVR